MSSTDRTAALRTARDLDQTFRTGATEDAYVPADGSVSEVAPWWVRWRPVSGRTVETGRDTEEDDVLGAALRLARTLVL